MIWPLSSTGTSMLWNRRLVLLQYCSWCSRRTSKLLTMPCKESNSLSVSFNEDFKCGSSWIRWTTRCACLDIISFCSSILFCCSFSVCFSGIICSSISALMLASTELFIESVIDSLILSDKMGMIFPRTSGLVSASITCTVIVFLCTGVFLVLTDVLRPFSPLMCYDASYVVFVVLVLLADLLDFQELVFYWVCQVFLVYFRMVIQIVYDLLVLRRLDCLLLWGLPSLFIFPNRFANYR